MMLMRTTVGLLSIALAAGCASTGQPEGPVDVDPAGRYTLTTYIQGTPVNGQMRIRGEPGDWSGAIYTDFTGELPITSIRVDGNRVLMGLSSPNGPVDIEITFEGESFSGSWQAGGDGGALEGRRVGS